MSRCPLCESCGPLVGQTTRSHWLVGSPVEVCCAHFHLSSHLIRYIIPVHLFPARNSPNLPTFTLRPTLLVAHTLRRQQPSSIAFPRSSESITVSRTTKAHSICSTLSQLCRRIATPHSRIPVKSPRRIRILWEVHVHNHQRPKYSQNARAHAK